MTTWDILSRASAFPLEVDKSEDRKQYFVGPKHSLRPMFTPKAYPEAWEWLQFVEPKHIRGFLELRREDGNIYMSKEFDPEVYSHPERDFSIFSIEKEEIEECNTKHVDIPSQEIVLQNIKNWKEPQMLCMGHDLNMVPADDFNCAPAPAAVRGYVSSIVDERVLLETEHVLTMGMCGGPVYKSDHSLLGMIEGIVAPFEQQSTNTPQLRDIESHACIVPMSIISDFLEDIRQGLVQEDGTSNPNNGDKFASFN